MIDEVEYNNLKNLTKGQLIQIIANQNQCLSRISETLVEESKRHISDEDAVKNIMKYLNDMPYYSLWSNYLAEEVDYQMQRSWIEYMWETEEEVFGDCRGECK